ncbi:hypothetical protein J2749_001488 [Methanobacterium oryzae]
MIETYKIVIMVITVSLVFYALINDPLKKTKLN